MEYGIPRPCVADALREVRRYVQTSSLDIGMPIEVRVTAPDDIALSMAYGRPTVFIATHMFAGQPFAAYFEAIESIMTALDGRPHWGKLHWQTATTLAPRYPQWKQFVAARRSFDPDGVFSNAYTDRVLGPP
jgi:L-gulonolactone oxidase